MNSLTDLQPKCLLEVKNKPLIEWQIDALISAGIKDIAIVSGYKSDLIKKYGLKEFHNSNWEKTGIVNSMFIASEWLSTDDCIITYSDIFYSTETIIELISGESEISISFDPNWKELWQARFDDPLQDAETFKVNDEMNLIEIGNSPSSIDEIQGQFMGLVKVQNKAYPSILNFYRSLDLELQKNLDMTSFLSRIIKSDVCRVKAIPCLGIWGEVDSASDLSLYGK